MQSQAGSGVGKMAFVQIKQPHSSEPIQKFLEHCHRKQYPAKSTIIRQGDPSHELYYVVKGSVTVLLEDEEGRELVLAYLNPGDFFGEIGLFNEHVNRSALVRAKSACDIAQISYDKIKSIPTVFPDLVLQQQGNSLQMRYVIPRGPDEFELEWTYFGYEDDSEETTLRRLRQANLTGPSGFVSIDDTEVLEYSGSGIRANPSHIAVVELGGREGAAPEDGNMVTEGPIRGFYEYYRRVMYGQVRGTQ